MCGVYVWPIDCDVGRLCVCARLCVCVRLVRLCCRVINCVCESVFVWFCVCECGCVIVYVSGRMND